VRSRRPPRRVSAFLLLLLPACGSTTAQRSVEPAVTAPPGSATSPSPSPSDRGRTSLHEAARRGDLAAIEALVAEGADLEATDPLYRHTPLLTAIEHGESEAAALLLRLGASLDGDKGVRALRLAAAGGYEDLVDVVLTTTSPKGTRALHRAAEFGHAGVAKRLLLAGADVDEVAQEDHGYTPLVEAAAKDNLDVAKVLLAAGASVAAVDDDGDTPLHWAVFGSGPEEIHRYPIGGGPHTTHWIPRDDAPMVSLLCKHGADPAARNREGNTPLHKAAMHGAVAAAVALLRCGANPALKNDAGETPLDLAQARDNGVVAVLTGSP
jgi:ankyrin repeat protein